MPVDDNWDWPFLMYIATVTLRRSEKAFWRMTPRKLTALIMVHNELNNPREEGEGSTSKKEEYAYIDQVW